MLNLKKTHVYFLISFVVMLTAQNFGLIKVGNQDHNVEFDSTDQQPEVLLSKVYIENADDGIGTYSYSNLFLPEINKKIETIVHSIEFEYLSFNIVKIRVQFENHLSDREQFQVYTNSESWKNEYFNNFNQKSMLPFLSVFLPEAPEHSYDKIDIYSRVFSCSLADDLGNNVDLVREVNQIIYHPDSYSRLFVHPQNDDKKYKVFAGHNVTFFSPPNNHKYTLEFSIVSYHPNIQQGFVVSELPMLFCTGSVKIEKYTIHWQNEYKDMVFIHPPLELDRPLDWYDSTNSTNLPRIKINHYENELVSLPSLLGRIYAGYETQRYDIDHFSYDAIQLCVFQNKLKLNDGINLSVAKINCPIPSAFYETLKENPNILIPPVVEYFLYNNDTLNSKLKVVSQVQNISALSIENVNLGKHEYQILNFIPNFNQDKIYSVLVPTNYSVLTQVQLFGNNQFVYEQTFEIKLLPYDTMIFRMIDETTGRTQTYYKYLTNWIKRFHSNKLDYIIKKILETSLEKKISGYDVNSFKRAFYKKKVKNTAEYSRSYIKALYNSLASLKIHYMNEVVDLGRDNYQIGQRIKFPKETLEQERGNCIDLAILFTYMIEVIGFNPILVIVPHHAYVGWETWAGSKAYEYLETTMVGYNKFEEAFSVGMQEANQFELYDYNKAYKIDIRKCKEEGIYSYPE